MADPHPFGEAVGCRAVSEDQAGPESALVEHVSRTIGAVEGVWAQIVPGVVRTDVIVVGADEGRPYRTLISTGMSSAAVPGTDGRSRTELVLALPADWPTAIDDASHWPFALLQNVAAYPHATGIPVGPWETLAFAEPPVPLGAGTELVACLVLPPRLPPSAAERYTPEQGVSVSLLALVPIYAAELAFARSEGARALAERLEAAGVTELLDPGRPAVASDDRATVPGLDALELPEKVTDELAALPLLLETGERPELLARAQLVIDRGLLVLTDRRLLFVSDNISRDEMRARIALPRSELDVLWGQGEHVVVRGGDVRAVFGDVQPRERVAELAATGPRPADADAHAARLAPLAADALGRVTLSLFRGRLAELAVELAPEEEVLHLSDGKLDRVNGLVVLTNHRLFFLGEAIRQSKRREEILPLERIRDHARGSGLRPSLTLTVEDGGVLDLRLGRSDSRHLSDALDGALSRAS
jgi:hypothetical protein